MANIADIADIADRLSIPSNFGQTVSQGAPSTFTGPEAPFEP